MRPLYIFDLDGTLADATHRLHFITAGKKDWDSFFLAAEHDAPIQSTISTLKALRSGGAEIWIWTGRSAVVERSTEIWLAKHGIVQWGCFRAPEALMMRPEGDHRPDTDLKFGWLADLEPPERKRLTAVFEDRSSVVQMWRDAGVTCYQVAPGEF